MVLTDGELIRQSNEKIWLRKRFLLKGKMVNNCRLINEYTK